MLPMKGKKKLSCGNCGKTAKATEKTLVKEELKQEKKLEVIDKDIDITPETQEECPKCKHDKAKFWTLQTRAGDEAETRFFECTKCKHRWREY